MKAIVNTKLIMEDGIIWDGALLYDEDKILDVGWKKEINIPPHTKIIDAHGLYTAPGLIDIHNHGCSQYWFHENPSAVSEYFLKHGITTVLPTFYHNMSKSDMIHGAERIREASQKGSGRNIYGLYMEGPFMNLGGSFKNQIKWQETIRKEDYTDLVDRFGDMVRIWAIDPEREHIEEFMSYVRKHYPNVIFAHGHSKSTYESIDKLRYFGVKLRTHITNADSPRGRTQGTSKGAGGDEYCLCDPSMYAELICDEVGIHVPPGRIKMIIRTKGVEHVCLISDHTTCGNEHYKNDEESGIWYGPDLNYDDRGWVAGSLMTLDSGVRNLMTHTAYGLCHSIRMATLTPAELLGIDHRVGSLRPGKTANLILIDDMVNVKKVILEGNLMVDNQ